MNAEEAAALGAIRPVGEVEMRQIPETDEECRAFYGQHQSAGRDGAQPPMKTKP